MRKKSQHLNKESVRSVGVDMLQVRVVVFAAKRSNLKKREIQDPHDTKQYLKQKSPAFRFRAFLCC